MRKLLAAVALVTLSSVGFGVTVTHTADARYTPGGALQIDINYDFEADTVTGLSAQVFVPAGWGQTSINWLSAVSPSFPAPTYVVSGQTTLVTFGFGAAEFDNLPKPSGTLSFTVDVPADYDTPEQVTVTLKPVINGFGQPFQSSSNPVTVNPPLPPVFTNPAPPQGQTAEGVPANITNTVIAGQAMQFQVTISASTGQALTGTAFAVGPAVWNAGDSKWELDWDHPETWFTYTPPARALPTGYVDFSDASGTFSRTVGGFTHNFTFTPISGSQDGDRVMTWTVPAGLVTKATLQSDRMFVVSSGGEQDNGGTGDFEWAVRVDPVNAVPVIGEGDTIPLTVDEDTNTTVDLTATDQDAGDTLTWSVTTAPVHGAPAFVALERDNNTGGTVHIQYTPVANYFGSDSFVVTVNDGDGGTDSITVNVTVNPTNDPPEATDDSLTIEEDSTNNTIDVLANDSASVDFNENRDDYDVSKVNGNAIVLNGAAVNTTHGSVLLTTENVGNGITRQVLRYTPTADYVGLDTFTYTIDDGNGGTASATVTVNVVNVNDPPDASDDTATVAEDSGATVIDVLANDTYLPDPVETLTVFSVTQPSHGTVTIGNGSADVNYTPAADYFGADGFTYTVSDGHGGTDTATVNVTVTAVNDPPIANDQSVFIQKGSETSKAISLTGSDIDTDPANWTFTIVTGPNRGTISNLDASAGTLTYTVTDPLTEFYNGNPDGPQADTFTFTIDDGVARDVSTAATVTITYRENQPPVVVAVSPGTEATPEDPAPVDEVGGQGQANALQFSAEFTDDNDPSGQGAMDSIQWYVDGALQGAPTRASLQSSFTFTLGYDAIANDGTGHRSAQKTFEVKAVGADTQGGTTEVVWNVSVNDVDRDPPAPTVSIAPAAPKTGDDLTASVDSQPADPDGDAITGYNYLWTTGTARPAYTAATLPSTATKKGDTWQVTVTPKTDPYNTGDVAGANSGSAHGTVGNTEPTATPQTGVTTDEDTSVDIQLAGVDPDVTDGVDTLAFAVAGGPSHGTLTNLDAVAGTVTYTPAQDYNGADSFTFTVSDVAAGAGRGVSAPATVDITINPVNDAPVASNLTTYTPIGAPVDITLQATDVDDGQVLTFTIVTAPQHGTLAPTVSRNSTGSAAYTYTPDAGYAGPDYFEYKATDDGTPALDSNTARVDIAVGTPPWFPILSWSNLGIVQPDPANHRTVYRLQIYGMIGDGEERQGLPRRFLDTWIVDATSLLPTDYDTAGNPGLLPNGATGAPADHYSWRVRAFVDGAPAGAWVDGADFTIDDYGLPGQGQTLASGQGQPTSRDVADDLFWFQFDMTNAAKYEIEITNNAAFLYRQIVAFQRRPDGTVEFVGPFTHAGVFLPPIGPFQWRVRGWNPLGWGDWSDFADEPGPTTGVDDATPSKPIPVGEKTTDANGNEYYQMASVQINAAGRGIASLQWSASHATAYQLVLRQVGGRTLFRGIIGDLASATAMPDGSYTTDDTYYRGNTVAGLKPGEYVWFVRGLNMNAVAAAPWGPWSSPCFFEVLAPAHEARPGRVEVLQRPVVTDNGDGTGNVTFYLGAQNADTFTIKLLDPNTIPRRFRTYTGIPAGDGVDQTVNGAVAFPMTRPAVYQVWAVGADGTEGPHSAFHVIRPPSAD